MDFVIIEWTLIYLGWGCRWLDSNLFQFHLCPMEHSTLTWFHILSCYRHWICKDLHNHVCEICFWINLYHYLSLNLFHSLQFFFLFSLWGIDYLDLAEIVLLWCFLAILVYHLQKIKLLYQTTNFYLFIHRFEREPLGLLSCLAWYQFLNSLTSCRLHWNFQGLIFFCKEKGRQ